MIKSPENMHVDTSSEVVALFSPTPHLTNEIMQ